MYLEPRPGTAGPSPHLRALKDAVRDLLGLDNDTAVVIRQLTRSEPGRPPRQTVVAACRWTARPIAGHSTAPPTRSPRTT